MLTILANIGNLILFLNLIIFSKGFSKHGKAYKVFTWYLGIIFSIQMISKLVVYIHFQNLFLSHFYFIGQFIILSFFYLAILKEDYQKKAIKLCLVFVLMILVIQYAYDTSLFFKFNMLEISITSFLLIIYAAFHFYNMLNEKKEFYYVNIGILMYLFVSTILFLVGNLTISLSKKMSLITWILNSILYIIYQILILIEWKKSYYKKSVK